MANFTVMAGANRLSRPVANGRVESGYLHGGEVMSSNLTYDTETGEWEYRSYPAMFIGKSCSFWSRVGGRRMIPNRSLAGLARSSRRIHIRLTNSQSIPRTRSSSGGEL